MKKHLLLLLSAVDGRIPADELRHERRLLAQFKETGCHLQHRQIQRMRWQLQSSQSKKVLGSQKHES
jgi:hypothetical protein